MLSSLLLLGLLGVASPPSPPPSCAAAAPWAGGGNDALKALFEGGVPFRAFLENARRRKDQWDAHYGDGSVTPEQVRRARAVGGTWRILAIAEDWCGDSANTIPYLARLVEGADNLEMRVVSSSVGRSVMEGHRTPDGRAATPTVLLLDEAWNEAGCFVERPTPLMAWYLEHRADKTSDELHEYIYAWYDADAGAATVDDVLTLLESAAAGHPRCGVAPG
ncbi:MAG TPA: thioredoxin family protein [Longimicrobiales bacterium]|nr:thioredoxin family protein [Longimicrobiales bacterium]